MGSAGGSESLQSCLWQVIIDAEQDAGDQGRFFGRQQALEDLQAALPRPVERHQPAATRLPFDHFAERKIHHPSDT